VTLQKFVGDWLYNDAEYSELDDDDDDEDDASYQRRELSREECE
jgi:hypothetical protein